MKGIWRRPRTEVAIQAGLVPEKQTHSLLYLEGPLVTHVP